VIVDEGWRSGSLSAEIMARIMEQAFWSLDGPVGRVCAEEVPIPYPEHLEGRLDPAGRRHRRRGPRRRWGAEMGVFVMPSLGADMETASWSNGWSSPATRFIAATWSPWSRPRKAPSRSRSSRTGSSGGSTRNRPGSASQTGERL
jgi:hypothetical protein